jgi:hypothetical protein
MAMVVMPSVKIPPILSERPIQGCWCFAISVPGEHGFVFDALERALQESQLRVRSAIQIPAHLWSKKQGTRQLQGYNSERTKRKPPPPMQTIALDRKYS